MIAMKRSCLDREEIALVLSGQLAPDDFESAISHLDDCDQCRSAAESLESNGDWMVQSLAGSPDPLQAETACQVALWHVMETPTFTSSDAAAQDQNGTGSLPQEMLGPYRLIRLLGSGGMAAVYLALHVRLQRTCALKILPRERVDQPGWLDRFDREMTTVASLEHPNVVRATDAGHQDGWHYLVMEHLDGLDVGRVASRMGTLDVADACEIVRQAALGLAHIHASGLVHRDIKPSNMMLTRDGNIKLLDLGLVLSGDDPLAVDDRLTTVGHLMGTMSYMAPEQLIDSSDVDARADIYALGATLYRLIAGKPPHHRHGGIAKQVMAITNQDPPPIDSVREDLDKELVKLVTSMISRDPASRPQSADRVAQRLSELGSDARLRRLLRQAMRRSSPETPTLSSTYRSTEFGQGNGSRKRTWRSLVAVGVIAAFIGLAGFLLKIATDKGDLVINSEKDGVVLSVSQGDEIVDRLQVQSGPDNRFTLRKGTYTIAIEGASGGLTLSENFVTIGRGSEAPVELASRSAERIYQGKNLNQWMTLLASEEDSYSLGQIMRAVEVLTRDTDARTRAANATLRTARLWGGFSSSSPNPSANGLVSTEPSQHYMHHLLEIFPRYGTDGLEAIDTELEQGNVNSRLAAVWLLTNYRSATMPPNFLDHLEKSVLDIEGSGGPFANNAARLAKAIAIGLLINQSRAVTGQAWLEDHISAEVAMAIAAWKKNPKTGNFDGAGGFGNPSAQWVLDETMLFAAIELQAEGRLEIDWDWIASAILTQRYSRVSDRTDTVFDAVAANASDTLLSGIITELNSMTTPVVQGRFGGSTTPQKSFWRGNQWIPAFKLGSRDSIWPKALAYYADHTENADESIALLEKLRKVMIQNGANPNHADKPFQWIDAAINKLKKR